MKDDRLYLIHIREAIERIEEYTQDGEEFFLDDHKTQDAVLRNLHTLAESSQRISNALKEQYPQVDWRILSAFRNVVVHDYLGISMDRVWDIVQNDLLKRYTTILPPLLSQLLVCGNQDVTAWTSRQVTDHTRLDVDFWFHLVSIQRLT